MFGAFDGATSLVGVLAGLIAAHTTPAAILATAAGLAVASAVSMASGDHMSGATHRQSAVMGVATFAGALLPAFPVAMLYGAAGYIGSALLIAALTYAIGRARGNTLKTHTTTAALVLTVSVLSAGAALLFNSTG